ncbi:hypothetical protein [Mucilaginibacter celer]|uniref:Uncharacterized protein n=1 Tax=Mucilaginibacter celer TaxID=2305508 RepID=A0A494W057_9SPHI|nr:hypothetical protein [Mucilaginibacter celer]AYL96622.1 hypothetical protein HYN43_015530 [Mucilaginibacter celer]
MKTTSAVLTALLFIPILGCIFFAFQVYMRINITSDEQFAKHVAFQNLLPVVVYLICLVAAIVLNVKQKYRENSIMCGTIVGVYILSVIVSSVGTFIANTWLK